MQVVFIQNVKGIAQKGEIKNVKEGYFQNYLFPNKLAVIGTPDKLKQAEEIRKKQIVEKERIVADAKGIKLKLDGMQLVLKRKSHEDKLYASITEKDLIEEILKKINVRLQKENIEMRGNIKNTGSHEVLIKLAEGVESKIVLEVQGEK